eukprot:TRINITY_DN31539_c0_g1_i1.p2 TRINITY_DN31539_c0_g1~~TRINITY_DN31539_c0_g1_i1.p2  ORF type:complete len:146 (-),score=36.92 TRINITY_DN31539_c0_g1_i1:252-689(-)
METFMDDLSLPKLVVFRVCAYAARLARSDPSFIRCFLTEVLRDPILLLSTLPESAAFADAFAELIVNVGDGALAARLAEEHLPELRETLEPEERCGVVPLMEGALERLRTKLAPSPSLEAGEGGEARARQEEEAEEASAKRRRRM